MHVCNGLLTSVALCMYFYLGIKYLELFCMHFFIRILPRASDEICTSDDWSVLFDRSATPQRDCIGYYFG